MPVEVRFPGPGGLAGGRGRLDDAELRWLLRRAGLDLDRSLGDGMDAVRAELTPTKAMSTTGSATRYFMAPSSQKGVQPQEKGP